MCLVAYLLIYGWVFVRSITSPGSMRCVLWLRGCLHEKTGTGASFIPGWLFDFVSRLHDDYVGTLHVDKIDVWFQIAIIQSTGRPLSHRDVWSFRVDMIPLRDLVPEWNSRSGTTIGVNTRRGDSRRHDIWWWYHVNKYRAMTGNGSELAPRRKSPRCPPYLLIYGWVFDLKLTAQGKKLFLTWLKQQ